MSFVNRIKHALGLGPDDEELLEQEAEGTAEIKQPEAPGPMQQEASAINSEQLSSDIFAAVVMLFNDIQPEFVKKCINTEDQKRYILNSIDEGVKRSLEAAQTAARRHGEKISEEERRSVGEQLEKLKKQYAVLAEQKNAFQNEQLSATRQKRALTERIHDLEAQVEQLASEKEQFELESRSMQNKLRVLSVSPQSHAEDSDPQSEDVAELSEKLKASELANAELRKEIGELKDENKESADLKSKVQSLRNERDQLHTALNELKVNLNFEQKNAKRAQTELKETQTKVKKLEVEIARLNTELANASDNNAAEADALRTRLSEKEAEINAMRASLQENMVKERPKRGRKPKKREAEVTATPDTNKTESSKKPAISAIDELLDESEWLVAPSATDIHPAALSQEPDDDFGYRAPQRKTKNFDDENQLTLF